MWLKWFPWKFILKKVATAQGFIDPVTLLSHFNRFAQPSEVWAPVELMRAGAVLHARGLINSQVIQHNLDWVWPYWAERQFDPLDPSFIPRAFSLTHINLTHRNWTAVGVPFFKELPVVDPRGLVMPFFDSWSIDNWIITQNGKKLLPSRLQDNDVNQYVDFKNGWSVHSEFNSNGLVLKSVVEVDIKAGIPVCRILISGKSDRKAWLVLALRPYNPEGISFIHKIKLFPSGNGWDIDGNGSVFFDKADYFRFSNYNKGDVYHWVLSSGDSREKEIVCDVGMASSMAGYALESGIEKSVLVEVPLQDLNKKSAFPPQVYTKQLWEESEGVGCCIEFPFGRFEELYKIALRSLVLHSPRECFAGPYTYKRFWFRDAAFIIHALLCAGFEKRAERIVGVFFEKQSLDGYFLSQEGEWDSNGEALWALRQYCLLSGKAPPEKWKNAVKKASRWIIRKRAENLCDQAHSGLFPPGFSAEHLGPNDYYYWDNFWGIAGLRASEWMFQKWNETELAEELRIESEKFLEAVEKSLEFVAGPMRRPIMPASPHRRPDSGAVGSLAAGYPLRIFEKKDARLMLTADFLFENCLIDGAFYHDISHSGINPYLTLHIAQVFLRGSDQRFRLLMKSIASLASPSGQWPEAIHPQMKTGCMGDGQHIWAAAEWTLIVRNCFVREEGDQGLILCAGICSEFLKSSQRLKFGPANTAFGPITIEIVKKNEKVNVGWKAEWFDKRPSMSIEFPWGEGPRSVSSDSGNIEFPFVEDT